ncbi:uncharacterized protein LAESUDRAFT_754409 [Laetiporus sulphureus 93-53]|uniref:Uncharacterized protein n=1 Tax=Laetiporus sulphureus 93-53 TaxID=1314785 RepID=A0A165HKV7_9APHY|nr:uncharacterized protein LAESUDRAFT_754409 [Laetiporus sulphureus 93-53]KZT11862.1 hypothetical protein LAESUDRAFT_754409 [Laetiporus sulphureus 93-53]
MNIALAVPPITVETTQSVVPIEVTSAAITSFLYGNGFLLYAISTFFLASRSRQPTRVGVRAFYLSWEFGVGTVLFAIVTAHWILTVLRLLRPLQSADIAHWQLVLSFVDEASGTLPAKEALSFSAGSILNAVVLYVVWDREKMVIVFPILTICGFAAFAVACIYFFTHLKADGAFYNNMFAQMLTWAVVLSFTTTIYCTLLIVFRVWRVTRELNSQSGSMQRRAVYAFVQSVALNALAMAFWIICFFVRSWLFLIAVDMWTQMTAISFMLLAFRVGLGRQQDLACAVPPESRGVISHAQPGRNDLIALRRIRVVEGGT